MLIMRVLPCRHFKQMRQLMVNNQHQSLRPISEDAFKVDKAAAEARLQSGRQLNEVKDAITSYDRSKAGMAIFETQANQGNITVTHETVKVSSKADVDKYQSLLNDAQTKVRDYVNTLNQTSGSVTNNLILRFMIWLLRMTWLKPLLNL